jgi:hypothetical protein
MNKFTNLNIYTKSNFFFIQTCFNKQFRTKGFFRVTGKTKDVVLQRSNYFATNGLNVTITQQHFIENTAEIKFKNQFVSHFDYEPNFYFKPEIYPEYSSKILLTNFFKFNKNLSKIIKLNEFLHAYKNFNYSTGFKLKNIYSFKLFFFNYLITY